LVDRRITPVAQLISVVFEGLAEVVQPWPNRVTSGTREAILACEGGNRERGPNRNENHNQQQQRTGVSSAPSSHALCFPDSFKTFQELTT
jgi:hypothetical protein